MPNVELESSGLICDHCDWKDESITIENFSEWLNKPCPNCGENLLTQEDYDNALLLQKVFEFTNTLSPELINNITSIVDLDQLKNSELFENTDGLDNLSTDNNSLSMTINTHKNINVTKIEKVESSIPLLDYMGENNSTIFVGYESGLEVRKLLNLNELDLKLGKVIFLIPEKTTSINQSFFLGLLYKSYSNLNGEAGFLNKYDFKFETKDDEVREILKEDIKYGLKECEILFSKKI